MVKSIHQDRTLYWLPETADDILKREKILEYAAWDQPTRVSPGDKIWVVTVRDGELFLLSKLHVGMITDRIGAMKQLNKNDVWNNVRFYAIAAPGTVQPLKQISIHNFAKDIRFESKSDKLTLDSKGRVNAQQLQRMRILKIISANQLEGLWQIVNKPMTQSPHPEPPEQESDRKPADTPRAADITEPPSRVESTTYRILRDTVLSRSIKKIRNFKCQVCHNDGLQIERDKLYAEVHHIRPLGVPHNGLDIRENVLCVCPNCHVLLDYGAIKIDISKLESHPAHEVGREHINYYNEKIFGKVNS